MRPLLDPIISSDLETLTKQLDKEEFQSKKILISGGAGFIGSWLCDILVSTEAAVECVDNLSTGLLENIEHLISVGKLLFRGLDVAEVRDVGRYDLILHYASRASPEEFQLHPIETLAANSQGTQNMLELARKSDAVFMFASSSEIYGNPQVIPIPETYWGNVNPIGPRSCYDEGKRFGEALSMAYHKAHGLDVRVVRLFNTYGPRLRSDGVYARALSRFMEQALSGRDITVYGKGDQTRSFCYVTDTVAAILRGAVAKQMKGQVVNVGNPQEISIIELAKSIKMATHSKSRITFHPRPPDDPQRRCPDISKAKRILGWSPTTTLLEGLTKTMTWFRQKKVLAR